MKTSRRDLLKFGGMGLAAASANSVWPLKLSAGEAKAHPRGAARNVLFYEFSGAISHVESFDFKENALPFVKLNVKMGETSDVRVVAEAAGKHYVATKEVKVTIGGCGG